MKGAPLARGDGGGGVLDVPLAEAAMFSLRGAGLPPPDTNREDPISKIIMPIYIEEDRPADGWYQTRSGPNTPPI